MKFKKILHAQNEPVKTISLRDYLDQQPMAQRYAAACYCGRVYMDDASPDVVVPMDVVRSMSERTDVKPRYNTVMLVGIAANEIYRNRQGRDLIAPLENNALYTDRNCVVPRGIELLSNSGMHGLYTVKMRWAEKYNLPLAKLGQIWQFNDVDGAWKGVITSVSVAVEWDNEAPTVWQTLGVDRYLDV